MKKLSFILLGTLLSASAFADQASCLSVGEVDQYMYGSTEAYHCVDENRNEICITYKSKRTRNSEEGEILKVRGVVEGSEVDIIARDTMTVSNSIISVKRGVLADTEVISLNKGDESLSYNRTKYIFGNIASANLKCISNKVNHSEKK